MPLHRYGMKDSETKVVPIGGPRPPLALSKFLEEMNVTAVTAWRWRKQGKLKVVNISGRLYVPQTAIEDFNRRAEAGDFAKDHITPTRPAKPSRTKKAARLLKRAA